MPAYAPTAKERKIVEKAAGFGLPHDKICQFIVSERTGKPIGLYNNAVHSNNPAGWGCDLNKWARLTVTIELARAPRGLIWTPRFLRAESSALCTVRGYEIPAPLGLARARRGLIFEK